MAYLGLSPEPYGDDFSDGIAKPTAMQHMTPQEIERYVKSSQGASGSGYWVVVAAIAALLLMNR